MTPNVHQEARDHATRRSSTLGTARGLFGSSGWITDHSKSFRPKRAIGTVKANFILAFGAGQGGMVTLFLLMNRRRVSCDSRPKMRYTHLL
jgi:hypothetical protein